MTSGSNRTDVGAQLRFAKYFRAIPFLLCLLLVFLTASSKAQTASSSPVGTSVVWGIHDDPSGEWVVWSDDSFNATSVVWGVNGDGSDAVWIDSVVWGNE